MKYWAIVAGTFAEITGFTPAVDRADVFDWAEVGEMVQPRVR